jgi:streptomycin 6-kinase
MQDMPRDFARRMIELHGEEGIKWLDHLPFLLAGLAQRWALAVLRPFEDLSYNYVVPVVRADGSGAILKVGVPNPELLTEIEALRLYGGRGIVQLLEADPERGALLLERLEPGTPLACLSDDGAATSIAAQVMRQLWRPLPADHPFPTVARWAAGLGRLRERFGGGTGPLPSIWVARAEGLFSELIVSMAEPELLHGDLHHHNILAAQRQPWLALDPKGVVGEPAYEVGALLRNPMPQILDQPDVKGIMARRVDQLAEELGFDRKRLVGWGVAQAVLSAWWMLEDHGHGWEMGIACAEHIAATGQNRSNLAPA